MNPWYVYIVQSHSGMLYTGISTDPQRRLRQHSGELSGGAKALRGKGPLQLVYQSQLQDKQAAARAEYQLKQLPRAAKLALIEQYKSEN